MSLTAQDVVERAGIELSRCISGLGLRARKPEGKMGSVRRGGVMEKVANVFCGNSTTNASNSNIVGGRSCKADANKPIPPEKPSRFLLGKVRNGSLPHAVAIPTVNGHQGGGGSPRISQQQQQQQKGPSQPRSPARTRVRQAAATAAKPTTWEELVRDEAFLNRFFFYFPALERATLAQVCLRWRSVLYQPKFWHGLRPVLHCRQLRSCASVDNTAEMRRRFYASVQTRGFDSLVLVCASDEDLLDLVANYAVNRTRNLRAVGLRCSSVTDKGVETLLDHLNGVYQLELQGCNEITEAGLWGCLSPRIVSLSVSDCINIADDAVGAIAQLLPSLYELNLQAYHVTDAALAFFSPKQTATLSILRLHSCWELTNHAIVNIVHALPHLTVLSLSGCSKMTDDGVELIAENLRKLRSLDLSWCPRITDAALEYIACDLNQLEELTLDRCIQVSDIGIGYVSTMLSLSALFLRWCSQIRDFGVQHLASMRNLHVLSLAGCTLISSAGLSALAQLRHLQELELTNCPGATPELHNHLRLHLQKCLIIE